MVRQQYSRVCVYVDSKTCGHIVFNKRALKMLDSHTDISFNLKIEMNAQFKFDENSYSTDESDSLYDYQNKGHNISAESLQRHKESSKLRAQRIRSDKTDDQRIQRLEQIRLRAIKNRSNKTDDQ